ncbi:MAG: glucose-6-phosphate dehydrogenase, partial [Armatimonadota bacterium]
MSELDPCVLVLFGATGDLTRRKLAPALYALQSDKLTPEDFSILAYARRDKNDESFRADLKAAVEEFAPEMPTEGEAWDAFSSIVGYQQGEFDQAAGYAALKKRLDKMDKDRGAPCNRLFYLAIPPEQYETVIAQIGEAGLSEPSPGCGKWVRIIIEKPFGHDLPSSRHLNDVLGKYFTEEQVYRIDHYLGKETVQNILVFRFANELFEPLWNSKYVDHVQITVAEKIGLEGRGNYFDETGIARDMLQNHALQILALTAMEPPASLDANSVRDEKVKAVRSIRPIAPDDVPTATSRGQYEGYTEQEGVKKNSSTETYAAMRFFIDNWRWSGVPFTVRAGKSLSKRVTEVAVQFKAVPQVLFARMDRAGTQPNVLVMRIQPDEGIFLQVGAKEP